MLNRPHAGWRTTPPDAPAGLAPWLTDRDSLTAALRSRCRQLRVECRWQGLAPVLCDESALLGVSPRGRVWVREVALVADGVPWVWARSVALPGDLRSRWRDLAGLGNRSLGAALFADRRVARGNLLVRRLSRRDPRQRLAAACFAESAGDLLWAPLWARRSLFCRGAARILVTEVFAPTVPPRQAASA
jgi:chorismate--pyruvate lyase